VDLLAAEAMGPTKFLADYPNLKMGASILLLPRRLLGYRAESGFERPVLPADENGRS
jgi:hypothetical protein